MNLVKSTYLVIFLLLGLLLSLFYSYLFLRFNKQTINGDGQGYYSFLPAVFIYHDLTSPDLNLYEPDRQYLSFPAFHQVGNGEYINKYPIGLAILWLPAFLLAIIISAFLALPIDGYNIIFQFLIGLSTPIYLSFGLGILLYILIKQLKLLPWVSWITIAVILLGTNLINYGVAEVTMSHAYAFFLMALNIYLIIKWHQKPSNKLSLFLGLIMGLQTLVRLSNVIIILLWIFYGIWSRQSFSQKIKLWQKNYKRIVIILLGFLFLISFQLAYFYLITGKLWYFAYIGEYFNLSNPAWYGALFSYRKGLLFWSPIIWLTALGVININKIKQWFWATLIFLTLGTYFIASWHMWWYGDSYGHRAFIDYYPLIAIWMAHGLTQIWKTKLKYLILPVVIFLVSLNLFLTQKYWRGELPRDNCTSKMFWEQFK